MALKTDYKDDIFPSQREYNINDIAGTNKKTIEDVTPYTQEGDVFGASDINATNDFANNIAPKIIVLGEVGASATITLGTFTETKTLDSEGKAIFSVKNRGEYSVAIDTSTKTVNVEVNKDYTVDFNASVMGVSRDTTSSSPILTRTDAAVGLNATASIGTSAGSSDFDAMPIYKDIKRTTLSTGDTMVEIPKFYYRRYREGNIEYEKISDKAKEGFVVHPAFLRGGVEYDKIYVGAYKTSSNNQSKSGKAPQVDQTRATMRTNAKSKGGGWGLIDIAARCAVNTLIKIEFATLSLQEAIGSGCSAKSAATNTGSCDGVPNLTGRPAGTGDQVDVVWRGIEGWWGNVWEWTDGLNFGDGNYYVSNVPDSYGDDTASGYTQLSFGAATNWSTSYITNVGLDENNPAYDLPSAAGSGSQTTYFCDAAWSSTGWKVLICGGIWYHGAADGPFCWAVNSASSYHDTSNGSRLLYLTLS